MADTRTQVATSATTTEVKGQLLSDHRALEELLVRLESALDGASAAELCEQWTRLELNLRDHLDTEERCLFPGVAADHRDEVEELRAEHEHIRCALSELGVAVDLHTLRKASVHEFIAYLQRHALREEHSLYQWINRDLAAHRGLRDMFERHTPHAS
jgi:hemerythrin-like domain-containing protein